MWHRGRLNSLSVAAAACKLHQGSFVRAVDALQWQKIGREICPVCFPSFVRDWCYFQLLSVPGRVHSQCRGAMLVAVSGLAVPSSTQQRAEALSKSPAGIPLIEGSGPQGAPTNKLVPVEVM